MTATVAAIYLWPIKRGDPVAVESVEAFIGGLKGDRVRGKKRQVTFLAEEDWADASREAGATADPKWRRANIVIRGTRLGVALGRVLDIGGARFHILGETSPCERMDEVHPGLMAALAPSVRAGVYGAVVQAGLIHVGDRVTVGQ